MNPWLQRILLSLAAGATASGVIVGTAKKPRRLKKRKKKKGDKDAPVQLGALALADAKLPAERGLTAAEWRDSVVERGKSVASVFTRKKATVSVDEGGRIPDEIESKDGTKVKAVAKKGVKKKRNRAKDMPPATLWESARESFKQTVKESVREEVKDSPVGGAVDALNKLGQRVKEGASVVAENVQKATADVKVDDELKGKITSKLSDWRTALEAAVETVRKAPEKPVNGPLDAAHEPKEIPPPAEGPPSSPDELAVQPGAVEEQKGAPVVEAELMPDKPAVATKPPIDPEKVKEKLKSGFAAAGRWFQAQSASSAKRVRPVVNDSVEAVDAEIVEAKDAGDLVGHPPPSPPPSEGAVPGSETIAEAHPPPKEGGGGVGAPSSDEASDVVGAESKTDEANADEANADESKADESKVDEAKPEKPDDKAAE